MKKIKLRYIVRSVVEFITGKSCDKCKHCLGGVSCDGYRRYRRCSSGIYPKGFESK